jgi:mannose-1-phosphate guanylyltransferase / mannose-6-phosphate isomerase
MAFFPVLLCGGFGTRLWPLSRRETPKQFVIWDDGKLLFERAYERATSHPQAVEVICLGNTQHRILIEALCGSNAKTKLLLEPMSRNTAASIASAALLLTETNPRAVLACIPSDQHIGDTNAFHRALTRTLEIAEDGWIVIMGVVPREASQSYGYILPGDSVGEDARRVRTFFEKPNAEDALTYVQSGYLWNSGMVIARADVLIAALHKHVPNVLSASRAALDNAVRDDKSVVLDAESFSACEAVSFDYAVLEQEKNIAVVDFRGDWSDVGSWPEFAKLYKSTIDENQLIGCAAAKSCINTMIYSPERLTVALGLRDCVVVDTPDAVLVGKKSALGELRTIVAELEIAGKEEVIRKRRVDRPWGYFESITSGPGYQVKRITVKPGAALSLQYHNHRAEHWVIVQGLARVTCNEKTFELKANQSTYLPQKSVHRLENPGADILEVIEVQHGHYLGEDDIVRLEDQYGRQ